MKNICVSVQNNWSFFRNLQRKLKHKNFDLLQHKFVWNGVEYFFLKVFWFGFYSQTNVTWNNLSLCSLKKKEICLLIFT